MKLKDLSFFWRGKSTKKCGISRSLALTLCMLTFAGAYAQTGKVNIQLNNAPVKTLFDTIEKQTSYRFSYRDADIAGKQNVTLSVENKELKDLLIQELAKRNLTYKMSGNVIMILPAQQSGASAGLDKKITGVVKDANGEPVIGANVTVKGQSSIGTITDIDGRFTLDVPSNSTLQVTFIGYATQEVKAVSGRLMNIVLAEDVEMLDEVVAIGYAKVQRRDLTGAISSVRGTELAEVPVTTTMQALQGKVAGVNIVTASGAPGASADITIRGGMSLTQGTEPLYIVDGFEMSDALDNIDVNDIESIDVLKDASSTAIYGARGSNGIILITTKSGKKGKTQVSYNTYFSFDKLSKKLDMLSNVEEFVKYQYERAAVRSSGLNGYSTVFDDAMGTDQPDFYTGAYARIADRYAGAEAIDWQEEMFGGFALTQSHNVNVSMGSERTQALLTYNYNGQDGLLANHSSRKSSFRAKINSELYKGVRLDVNALFTNKSVDGGGSFGNMRAVLVQPIHGGTLFTRDELLYTQTYPEFTSMDSSYDTANQIVSNEASTSNKRSRLFMVNAGLEFDFLKYFTYRVSGSYTWSNTKSTSFADENSTGYIMDPELTGISGGIDNSEYYRYQITNTLTYNQTFAQRHKLNVLVGHEVNYYEAENNDIDLRKFPYPNHGLDQISSAEVSDKSSGHSHNGMVSAFVRANYNFDERYLLTATLRADGSSKFAPANQWGLFPSVSAAWRISEEAFWKEKPIQDVINNLKLRVGYGTTGNNGIGDRLYITNVSLTAYPINNVENNPAYIPGSTLGNKDLKWETLASTNVGLDISLFNSRVNLTAEWYNNESKNLLMKATIPTSTGYTDQYQNIAKIRNRGWEVTLNTVNVRSKNFTWTSDLNLSFNKSKVLQLENGLTEKTFGSGRLTYYATVGESLGDMYGFKYLGVYTTDDFTQNSDGTYTLREGVVRPSDGSVMPGDIKYAADDVDENGNPIFTRKKVKIGNGTPVCVGGFNNTFTYKGFDLSIFMKFAWGHDIYNGTKQDMAPYAQFQNIPTEFNNYYRMIDPVTGKMATSLARLHELNPDEGSRLWSLGTTNATTGFYGSSYYVENGSYLRIAQLTLGYTLPKNWTKRFMISNARIYFTANNLATITGYSGYDPEVKSGSDSVICTPGYDSSMYPRSRSYVIGLNLTF